MSDVDVTATARPGSEQLFRLLVEQVRDYAIFMIDPAGRIATWNAGAERIKGYTASDIIGQPYATFFTDADRATGKPERLLRRARTEGRVEEEGWRVRKDGSRFWADAVLTAVHDAQGELRGYAKVTRDLTEIRWGQEQQFLAEASRELAASLNYETTLQRVARLAVPRLADWCAVEIVDERGEPRLVAAAHGDAAKPFGAHELARQLPGPDAGFGAARVLRTGKAEFYSDVTDALLVAVASEQPNLRLLRDLGVGSAIIVPLAARGETFGALSFARAVDSARRYTEADLAVAEELGRQAALAIDNARLYAAEQQIRTAAERLVAITQQIGASLTPAVILDQIAAAAAQLLGSAFAGVFLLEIGAGDFALAAGRGLVPAASTPLRLPRGRSVAGNAVAQRRTIVVEDVAAEPGTSLPQLLSGESIGSLVVAPIVAGAEPLGVIEVYATAPRAFSADAAQLLAGLAAAAAVALTNARLYEDTQERATALAALNATLREVAETRDRALTDAEAARRHLHELFMQAPAAIAITRGPDHIFDFANPLYLRMVGRHDPGELLGRPASEVLPERGTERWLELANQVYASGEPFIGQEMPTRSNPTDQGELETSYFTFVLQPYCGTGGEVAGLLSHAVEVTDLVRARQRVEALAAERDAFLAAASHDLKSPLAAIKGTAQFLRRQLARTGAVDPDRLKLGLTTIEETSNRMLGLVEQLLDVARLRLGQTLDLDRRSIDLVALSRRVAAAQQQTTERHAIRIESDVDQVIGEWDGARLGRVLANLLDNAVKYSPRGGDVVIKLADVDGWAVVSVRDQGIGVPVADRGRIFEPFQRGANVAGRIAGTGIGLAGSKQIVEQHGGTIAVDSQEGVGTTITFRIPLAAAGPGGK